MPKYRFLAAVALGCASVVGIGMRAAPSFESGSLDCITIDASGVTRTLSPSFYGVNYVGSWDAHEGSAAGARALAQTPIGFLRFPGGDPGDWYDWQDPYYKHWSTTTPLDVWRYARRLGATVLFQTNYQGHLPHPPHQPYGVNSPENAAAWVRYNRTHGIAAFMEVGNEEDITMHRVRDPSFQPYARLFTAQARAMHAADPRVRVFGPAATNEYSWRGLGALDMFLQATGNRTGSGQIDGVSLHFYAGSTWDDSKGVAQYWSSPNGPWAFIQRTIRAHDTRALPVLISEWNIGGGKAPGNLNPTLGHALVTADMVGAFAESGVMGQVYFDIHGSRTWGFLYGDGEGRRPDSAAPTYYAMALWGHMGTYLLHVATSAGPATVSAYATKQPSGAVQALVINKGDGARTLCIRFAHFDPHGRVLRVYDLRGRHGRVADLDAVYNGVTMPAPWRPLPGPRVVGRVAGRSITYTLTPYSAAVLDISAR